jgi:hypothetical protein
MGIVIEGDVLQDSVMGSMVQENPRVVLKKLLEASSNQYKMVSDGTAYSVTKVVLSLRSTADATAEKSVESASAPTATAATTGERELAQLRMMPLDSTPVRRRHHSGYLAITG